MRRVDILFLSDRNELLGKTGYTPLDPVQLDEKDHPETVALIDGRMPFVLEYSDYADIAANLRTIMEGDLMLTAWTSYVLAEKKGKGRVVVRFATESDRIAFKLCG